MIYLYHRIRKDFQRATLYPLNTLRTKYPEIYASASADKKYQGREEVKLQKIPFLNCLWNDVIHLSPIHPSEIKNSLFKAGYQKKFAPLYFKIDSSVLNPENSIIYLNEGKYENKMDERNFLSFSPTKIEKLSQLPQKTKEYYFQMIKEEKDPLLYAFSPHILYKGMLNVRDMETISLET